MPENKKAIFWLIVTCVLLLWNPSRSIPYVVPYLFLFGLLMISAFKEPRNLAFVKETIYRFFFLAVVVILHSLAALTVYKDFSLQNLLLALVTYSAVIFFICTNASVFKCIALEKSISTVLCYFVIFQGLIGITQSAAAYHIFRTIDLASGDLVTGTFDILSWRIDRGFENPIFSMNMACCLIFLYATNVRLRLKYTALILGLLVFILSSVMHLTYFLLLAHFFATIVTAPKFLSTNFPLAIAKSIFGTAIVLIFIFVLLPTNADSVRHYGSTAVNLIVKISPSVNREQLTSNIKTGKSYGDGSCSTQTKLESYCRQAFKIPLENSAQPVLGFGLGQYNSKAALIATGLYFGSREAPRNLPLVTPRHTDATEKYLEDLWALHSENPYKSSSTAPWSSWLAFIGEFGALFFIALGLLYIIECRRAAKSIDLHSNKLFSIVWMSNFIFLAGFQEHYWETPEALFTPFLLLKLLVGNLKIEQEKF